ncbi:unnamed protein product [Rotaria sp. Silwood1]|nr:unnamed protein product [Rotaria sp. Silwood1]CAF4897738.1 unnamed protein product [Rotaria sp. Silwood1]
MNNVSNLTSSPSTIKPTPYRVQNYLVIWVDGNIDQASQDCQNTMAELRSIVKEVNVCTTSAQCIEILDDLDDEKAFVISSGALGQRLVPDIHRMPQLDTIYIFCSNKAWHEQWAKQWPKIQEATLPPNHPSLAISYGNIGGMYCAMGDYAKALEFGEKALAIQQKSLPSTHSAIKRTINNINYVKKKM